MGLLPELPICCCVNPACQSNHKQVKQHMHQQHLAHGQGGIRGIGAQEMGCLHGLPLHAQLPHVLQVAHLPGAFRCQRLKGGAWHLCPAGACGSVHWHDGTPALCHHCASSQAPVSVQGNRMSWDPDWGTLPILAVVSCLHEVTGVPPGHSCACCQQKHSQRERRSTSSDRENLGGMLPHEWELPPPDPLTLGSNFQPKPQPLNAWIRNLCPQPGRAVPRRSSSRQGGRSRHPPASLPAPPPQLPAGWQQCQTGRPLPSACPTGERNRSMLSCRAVQTCHHCPQDQSCLVCMASSCSELCTAATRLSSSANSSARQDAPPTCKTTECDTCCLAVWCRQAITGHATPRPAMLDASGIQLNSQAKTIKLIRALRCRDKADPQGCR